MGLSLARFSDFVPPSRRPMVRTPRILAQHVDKPDWQSIIAIPDACRAMETAAKDAGFPIAWRSRNRALWELEVFCTEAEMDRLQGGPKAA